MSRAHQVFRVTEKEGAESTDGFIGQWCEDIERPFKVRAKLGWRKVCDQAMGIAVGCDFVAAAFHLANEIGMAFGHPTQHEECALYTVPR
jgi:hypothetical protein